MPDRLHLTLGAKLEHNNYSGVEFQPGVRLAFRPDPDDTLWVAVTRAVRVPSRVETDYTTASLAEPRHPLLRPAAAESRTSRRNGWWRMRPAIACGPDSRLFVSFAGFYNDLDDVLSTEILTPFTEPAPNPVRLIAPVTFGNGLEGDSYGAEVSADVRPVAVVALDRRTTPTCAFSCRRSPESLDGSQERRNEGLSPRHQVQAQTSFDLPGRVVARWPGPLRLGVAGRAHCRPTPPLTPDWRGRSRPGWNWRFVGQDLAQAHHVEWTSSGGNIGIQRSAYVKVTWRQ